jgi:hypothetical protein
MISEERYARLSRKYENLYNLRFFRIASIVSALALIFAVYESAWAHGIYEKLSSSPNPMWAHVAYSNWWANPASHPTLFLYSFAVAVFLCYYNIRNSIAGFTTVLFCWEIFAAGNVDKKPVLKLDTANRDGLGSIGILREMLSLAFQQVCISFASLCLIYCCFGLQRSLVPLYSAFILLPPLQLLLVLIPISRRIRESKNFQIIECRQELEAITKMAGSRAYLRLVREPTLREIERLVDIPDLLFSLRNIGSWTFAYYIPAILFVDWVNKL